MMVALILAQIVLPWPGLDSPFVQPGPTICVGECAGPVVWGPAERGRLVVACDMTSDTCSDGRKITTQRATPVPCETSPGVWEMVPEDTGCYSVRGLESWAATTSYLAYGADLTNTAWLKHGGMSVEKVGSVYRIRRNKDNTEAAFVYQEIAAVTQQETWTAACVMRAGTATVARMSVDRGVRAEFVNLTSEWKVFATTRTFAEGRVPGVSIGPEFTAGDIYIEVAGCWLTKTDTPGRPCWGGEAPVTCAADQHRISTEGWPTESGEICVSFVPGPLGELKWVLDGRSSTITGATRILLRNDTNRLEVLGAQGGLAGPTLDEGQAYTACVKREAGQVSLILDGEVVASAASANPFLWAPEAGIGGSTLVFTQRLNGSIRSLRIRSYEEVSP